ncbi:MAG: NAD-glutamate dehydrogenase [Gammaproteobacteria bacterium]
MSGKWTTELQAKLTKRFGASKGATLSKKYLSAFSPAYQDDFSPVMALDDVELMENLSPDQLIQVNLYENLHEGTIRLYLKLIQYGKPIPLSDVLPMLENMNLRTFSERPYRIDLGKEIIWISDFSVSYVHASTLNIAKVKDAFQDALIRVSNGTFENDGFNKLILGADLTWREILIIRAYAKYLQQIGFRFSQAYIEKTLALYPAIARDLIELFKIKFDPKQKAAAKNLLILEDKIKSSLETVTSLDEDRILRTLYQVINATLRTNYFLTDTDGNLKPFCSFKLESAKIPDLPLPHPLYEVFVYSPRFEAIHLRSAKVARGGIRWSDRREDFRTEILGLMKAQKVKNAIIVPSGAKGGFVLKAIHPSMSREELLSEVMNCYKSFMRGLLDITDNFANGDVTHPKNVVCYDDEDPYLVVAADKGTATFSDIANSISKEYHFWLGDAFASGGSVGYDHKKMGITARGAWESIKRHFRNLSFNVMETDFTVVGIGDMSGDVFGNGMLYTDHIKLVAAFDHRHIFIDPNPNAKKSFQERKRLFDLPASSWADYNAKLISKGGGVFSRASKSIPISPEMKKVLDIQDNFLAPTDLIRAILKAPVDLLFNGGIGTYVKAISESHADVGDKSNEFTRINGNELRARVVGEGGNLGFTQLGRIEFALKGGLINTDFIDNSAGVDCSDHEVNIKILLNREIKKGKLTEKKRNQLLATMTDDVASLVLNDNYNQALAMAFSTDHAKKLVGLYQIYLKELENAGIVNRVVEFLPDDRQLVERKAAGLGLTSPELAVLLAYTKIHVKNEILNSTVPDDPYLSRILETAFPAKLNKLYTKALQNHPLRKEIIATQLSNKIVNETGMTFVYRMQIESGAPVSEIIRAQVAASVVFGITDLLKLIDSLHHKFPAAMQYELLHHVRTLVNLATRWFLGGNRLQGDLEKIINHYSKRMKILETIVPDLMVGVTKTYLQSTLDRFYQVGISKEIALRVAVTRAMYTGLNVIEVATQNNIELLKAANVYFKVGSRFNLVWFRDQIASDSREGHWNNMARLTLRDELDILQKLLTVVIICHNKKEANVDQLIESWVEKNSRAVERWSKIMELLYGATAIDYSMFFIAVRQFSNWLNAAEK